MGNQGPELKLNATGRDVEELHQQLEQAGQPVPPAEKLGAVFGPGTREAVIAVQKQHGLEATGIVDAPTASTIGAVAATGPFYLVQGTVTSPSSAAVGGLGVEIVDKNVGGDTSLASGSTNERGEYEIRFAGALLQRRGKAAPDLQARISRNKTFLGASDTYYDAPPDATLDVVLPADASLPSEYETLTGSLAAHYKGKLADLKEENGREDVTYLANKTGWDARAVALAALAEQFAGIAGGNGAPGIPPALYYSLFRAGVPANDEIVYRLDAKQVSEIWQRSIDAGVVPPALKDGLGQSLQAFEKLRASHALDGRALAGSSTLKELLEVSLGDDQERQQRFAQLFAQNAAEPEKLWKQVEDALGPEVSAKLQLDGRLAFLTLDNAPLVARLHGAENDLASTRDLALRGYHQPEKWAPLIEKAPDQIPGATDDEKKQNYADVLATQVRLSYPTSVLADRVAQGEVPLSGPAEVGKGVQAFLTDNQDTFEIGMHPVERFIAQHQLGDTVAAPIREELKRIQRVYQITPSDEAMTGLLLKGVDSAFAVVRYREDDFVEAHKGDLGGEDAARLTYAKAVKVHGAVLNIASAYLTARRGLSLGAPQTGSTDQVPLVDPGAAGDGAHASDVVAQPTLETLFGSMDFCSCSECRSILSPAAYLVDLLLFADPPVNAKESPQKVLLERRPDIQYLPLTCENTNTPLPYVDVVNETLEYFVAHTQSLAGYQGHDTGDVVPPEEQLATPQYVDETVYDTLRQQLFPPPLPFHKSLETLRRYFATFGVPLAETMEALRTSEGVERANAASYAWRDILMEQLGLSRDEYRLLTDRTLTVQELYGFPGGTTQKAALDGLKNVKAYARRVGISYVDLVAILQTSFVNPSSGLIPQLERLGVPFSTLKALKDGTISDADFQAALSPTVNPADYGGDVKAWVVDPANYAAIMGLIVIANPKHSDDLCAIDDLELRYASPDAATNDLRPIDFVRLARFARLWRKLDWTVAETDKAISALYPSADLPQGNDDAADLERLDNGFLALLPRLGVAAKAVERLKLRPSRDLSGLLACWAPIDANGEDSLYRSMFGSPALEALDPAFAADAFGNVLADANAKLLDHADALRAAFGLTADELTLIVAALGFDATTALTLETLSAVYRRGWLARRLRLSVRELLALADVTVDPFAAPDPPDRPLLRLLDWVQALRDAQLKPVQALYLIWNKDLSGKSVPDDLQVHAFARLLRTSFAAIEAEYVVADDPTGEIARTRMALVYGNDATDFFFGLLGETFSVDVPYSHPQATLEQPILDAAGGRIGYDDFAKRLSYAGLLSTTARDALKNAAAVSAAFTAAVDALYAASEAAVAPFFARYPELKPLYDAFAASTDPPATKRTALLAAFLPQLKAGRKRQQAEAAIAATARTDSAFADTVLGNVAVLHAAADTTQPALVDLTAVEQAGLSAQFFWRDTATGGIDRTEDAVPTLAYSAAGPVELPANPTAGQAISAIWSGYLDSPQNGFFDVAVETDAGASVKLAIDGQEVALVQSGNTWSNTSPISLAAGTLKPMTLTVEKIKDAMTVRWATTGRGRETIPSQYLYSATLADRLRATYVRFLKVASLAVGLKLTANEIAYLASNPDLQVGGQGWFDALAVSGTPPAPTAHALRDVFQAVLDFARIKRALSPDDERLLQVLQAPDARLETGDALLPALTGWDETSLADLLTRLGHAHADLAHLSVFARVYDTLAVVGTFGISTAALAKATTNDPTATTTGVMLAAVRARYDDSELLDLIRPINDVLRTLRRDALVAYVLQKLSENPATSQIDTVDKLFEYFLMDVEMDSCALTSRVRHALSSVQLFIERCLMNLEQPRVDPSSIDASQWSWMKRYRVWEANRKVFLWPENWLDPELRDDQSSFFKETMSELLQSDITEDTAAVALLNYLSKLEEVAKLEPCGIYFVEGSPGAADDIAHVVARTAGAHRKYWYRRAEYGYWTPWEQIKLDIEDNPVIPVVWKSRLFLFWLKILKKTPIDPDALSTTSTAQGGLGGLSLGTIKSDAASGAKQNAVVDIWAVLCWSEYYNGKWQPAKTSDPDKPTYLGRFGTREETEFDRSQLRLAVGAAADTLRIDISGEGFSSFLLYNTHSVPVRAEDSPASGIFTLADGPVRLLETETDTLAAVYLRHPIIDWGFPDSTAKVRPILKNAIGDGMVEPLHPLLAPWDAPFFYEDSRHLFYVTTAETTVTIQKFNGYGLGVVGNVADAQPPLVLKQDPRLEKAIDKTGIVAHTPGYGKVDPSPIERELATTENIRAAFGSTSSVIFGGKQFGPKGPLADSGSVRQ
jgi:peptidoglycan hydrolase-like protein with peptidoglycan-binding domain